MSVITTPSVTARTGRPPARPGAARGGAVVYLLAALAVPIVVWECWTVVAWLADGPHQITRYRQGRTVDWYAARVFEGLMVAVSLVVAATVVRGCLRARRFLTFDMMFCLVGSTLFWANIGANFFHPVFLVSSNWTNLNSSCGHIPFIVNPDCGRVAEPILFLWLMETFGVLGLAIVVGAGVRRLQARRPDIGKASLVAFVAGCGILLVVLEPVVIGLRLWTYPGRTPGSLLLGDGFSFPVLPELFSFGLWFAALAAIRIFKDDRGQSIVERGLERHRPALRSALSLAALYALMQTATWGIANVPLWPLGFYAQEWPELPAYVVNGVCDAPGVEGTRYGPCPGSPGFRMPGRHSLPGE